MSSETEWDVIGDRSRPSDLKIEEIAFLSALARRGYTTSHTEPYPRNLRTPGRKFKPPETLRVATLAVALDDPHGYCSEQPMSRTDLPERGEHYRIVEYPDDDLGLRQARVLLQRSQAQGKKPHFLLLNELALCRENRSEIENRWGELAREFNVYIIPGTYNCQKTYYSVAPIFCPTGNQVEFLKQTCAWHLGERIRTSDHRSIIVSKTDYGNLVLWVCLDLYDPALVLKYLAVTNRLAPRQGNDQPFHEIHLLLVPSFSPDELSHITGSVRLLSQFSQTTVICCNVYVSEKSPKVSRLESIAFCGGQKLEELSIEGLSFENAKAQIYEVPFHHMLSPKVTLRSPYSKTFQMIVTGKGVDLLSRTP